MSTSTMTLSRPASPHIAEALDRFREISLPRLPDLSSAGSIMALGLASRLNQSELLAVHGTGRMGGPG
jgi:hypothetical protein